MGTNRDPQLDNVQIVRELGTLSPKCISILSLQCSGESTEGETVSGEEGYQGNMAFNTQQDGNTNEFSEIVAACTGPGQV